MLETPKAVFNLVIVLLKNLTYFLGIVMLSNENMFTKIEMKINIDLIQSLRFGIS